jgi:hypothetical protein
MLRRRSVGRRRYSSRNGTPQFADPAHMHAISCSLSSTVVLYILLYILHLNRILYKIISFISHLSPTTFSKSRSLYIKPYIRNVLLFQIFVRTYLSYLKCYGHILFLFNSVFKT